MDQKLLLDQKWKKLTKLGGLFRFVPFIEFVVATGSMAVGNVTENSDFDVLVSVKGGRMFTARYALNLLFSILGRRRLKDSEEPQKDKLCFNHFVTEPTWAIRPINSYSTTIAKNWVPIWGDKAELGRFFARNSRNGMDLAAHIYDLRFNDSKKSFLAKAAEKFLAGKTGDFWESNIAGAIAKRRLRRYVAARLGSGRSVVNDHELEFHFYPKS